MGGGGTKTTSETSTSGLSNPAMNAAATTIGNQLNSALAGGVKPYTQSMVPGLSSQTQAGIGALTNNPNNSIYSQGIGGAIASMSDVAAGNIANDAVRQRVADDAAVYANSTFTNSGRFGSGSHREGLGEGIGNALAAHDYGRQQSAMAALPGLYQASMLPASANLQAGQITDAYNTAKAADDARIWDATNNANWNTLQRGGAIFGGTAPVSGTTTTGTQTQPTAPWWQGMLGFGLGLL